MSAIFYSSEQDSWKKLWNDLDKEFKDRLLDFLLEDPQATSAWREAILDRLTRAAAFRPQSIRKAPAAKLKALLQKFGGSVFDHRTLQPLLVYYYAARHGDMMAAFLDALGLAHDGQGLLTAEHAPAALPEPQVTAAVEDLCRRYPPAEVSRYFRILLLQGEQWAFLRDAYRRLAQATDSGAEPPAPQAPDITQDERPERIGPGDEFTTLDRVLIDQIVATVAGLEGSLSAAALEDLIETVISLNNTWQRSYFHLGLMDALLPGREPWFDRPEFNDNRRQWYLTGVLTGYARLRDKASLGAVLGQRAAEFDAAARKSGGPGATMAANLFECLLEAGRLSEATLLMQGQLSSQGAAMAVMALDRATDSLLRHDVTSALPLLRVLKERSAAALLEPNERAEFALMVERRWGQCLQYQGDLAGAREVFLRLLDSQPGRASANLLADLGLVEAGFKRIDQLRLPNDLARRDSLAAALAKGRGWFQKAVETGDPELATNGHYALAVMHFLLHRSVGNGRHAEDALNHVQRAITGMRLHRMADAYQRLGLLGQALFIKAILQMESLEPMDAEAAFSDWQLITPAAGDLPAVDLQNFLMAAAMVDQDKAVRIAESIWRYRKQDALKILLRSEGNWLLESEYLREQLLEQARNSDNRRRHRWRIWTWLVTVFLRGNMIPLAAEGLDALEELADSAEYAGRFLEWLDKKEHFDPAWSQYEVDWAKVKAARKLGDDNRCAALLRGLFFQVRDKNPDEGAQILEVCRQWKLAPDSYQDLHDRLPQQENVEADGTLEQRLRGGAVVRVLFVGGNETQAQYDERIRTELRQEWPNLDLRFVHTGWSSNWGRDRDRLLKQANGMDAVVLMRMMRTQLGRELRQGLEKPWISCVATGKGGMEQQIRKAALIGLQCRAVQGPS